MAPTNAKALNDIKRMKSRRYRSAPLGNACPGEPIKANVQSSKV